MQKEREIQRWLVSACINQQAIESAPETQGNKIVAGLAVDERGIELYRKIIDLELKAILERIFPLCARLLGSRFADLARRYLEQNLPVNYKTIETGKNFSDFVARQSDFMADYPFLKDMVSYEFVLREVLSSDDEVKAGAKPNLHEQGAWMSNRPIVNPTLKLESFQFPVLAIEDLIIDERWDDMKASCEEPKSIAIYRMSDHNSGSLVVSQPICDLLRSTISEPRSYQVLLEDALTATGLPREEDNLGRCLSMFETFHDREVFIGFSAAPE